MDQFSNLNTRADIADFLNVPHKILTHILYIKKIENCYSTFEIPKKNGGVRTIAAPCEELREMQSTLATRLLEYQRSIWHERNISPNISHAFEPGKSIITNAKIHRNKRYILNLDLKCFFETIHFGRVCGFFQKHRDFNLPYEAAVIIAQLTCFNGSLPQGAPTSPIIANMICQSLDMRLLSVAKQYKLDYTRYADDLTFSTNNKYFPEEKDQFMDCLIKEIAKAGFIINENKTRLLFRDSRQEVTGLVVNKKLSIPRDYIKATRAMAYELYTKGKFKINGEYGSIAQLEGRFSFIDQLDHYNNKIDQDSEHKHDSFHLCGREKQYRAFLFYKYFFAHDKPIIITEGKTDIRYIKAALKNQFQSYPDLIEKTDDGQFQFKITFLNRSKRLRYFFGMSIDGADALKTLYRYFSGSKGCPNYMEYFQKHSRSIGKSPVVLLYDNETKSKRPLQSFLSEGKVSDVHKDLLQKQLYLKLFKTGNLYLVTNPLKPGMDESEIEDLFPEDVLEHKIHGKKFTRKESYDTRSFYGKDIFSTYVMKNYQDIDFTNFLPLLDAIVAVKKSM